MVRSVSAHNSLPGRYLLKQHFVVPSPVYWLGVWDHVLFFCLSQSNKSLPSGSHLEQYFFCYLSIDWDPCCVALCGQATIDATVLSWEINYWTVQETWIMPCGFVSFSNYYHRIKSPHSPYKTIDIFLFISKSIMTTFILTLK